MLYVITYEPGEPDVAVQPYGIGTACFGMPLSNGSIFPPPVTLVNTIGYEGVLGHPLLSGIPSAPCIIVNVPGFPAGTYTFQGYIFDNGSGGPGLSLTNAIVVKVL